MKNIEREIEQTTGALDVAEQQLRYWKYRVDLYQKRLVLQREILNMTKPK